MLFTNASNECVIAKIGFWIQKEFYGPYSCYHTLKHTKTRNAIFQINILTRKRDYGIITPKWERYFLAMWIRMQVKSSKLAQFYQCLASSNMSWSSTYFDRNKYKLLIKGVSSWRSVITKQSLTKCLNGSGTHLLKLINFNMCVDK